VRCAQQNTAQKDQLAHHFNVPSLPRLSVGSFVELISELSTEQMELSSQEWLPPCRQLRMKSVGDRHSSLMLDALMVAG
jgi:hypothetical protein